MYCLKLCIFSPRNEVTPDSTLWSVHNAVSPVPLFSIKHLICSNLTLGAQYHEIQLNRSTKH